MQILMREMEALKAELLENNPHHFGQSESQAF